MFIERKINPSSGIIELWEYEWEYHKKESTFMSPMEIDALRTIHSVLLS